MHLGLRLGRLIVLGLLALLLAAPGRAQAQTLEWVRQFGTAAHDRASAVTADAAGNIYVGGSTRGALPTQSSAGSGDAFVARYDQAGQPVWFRQFGTTGEDSIAATATDVTGNVYASGFTVGNGLLVKYDSAGNQLWMRQFGPTGFSTVAGDVATDPAGNVYVIGTAGNLFGSEAFLAKYSPAGVQLWSRPILTATLYPLALATDLTGHVYVVGPAAADAVIAQYDALGNEVWRRQFGTASIDTPQDVATNALGEVYIVGLQDGYDLEASFLAQYDSAGNQQWVRAFTAETFPPWAMALATDAEGNAVVGGFIAGTFAGQTSAGTFDAFVLEYDRAGTQQWVRQFGTAEQERVSDIAVDAAGNIYVSGDTTGGTFAGETHLGEADAFLARLTTTPAGPGDVIAEARTALAAMTTIADGIRRSLDQKLAAAQRSVEGGRMDAACGQLTAFANEVSAQDGKNLTADQVVLLRTAISAARAGAGCDGAQSNVFR